MGDVLKFPDVNMESMSECLRKTSDIGVIMAAALVLSEKYIDDERAVIGVLDEVCRRGGEYIRKYAPEVAEVLEDEN